MALSIIAINLKTVVHVHNALSKNDNIQNISAILSK